MVQTQFTYPQFVADQVLTSDDLNEIVNYLDEQQRLTRVLLLGIGNICGFQVTVAPVSTGLAVTIGAGCGVTSSGILVQTQETTYTQYHQYIFNSSNYYKTFCQPITAAVTESSGYGLYPTNELIMSGASVTNPATIVNLTSTNLAGQVLVLFAELNSVSGQNCNPESCDGLGVEVNVTFRPLLMAKTDIDNWLANNATSTVGNISANIFYDLPDLSMPRFNVPMAGSILTSGQFFATYSQLFANTLLSSFESAFTMLYTNILPLVEVEFTSCPFTGFATSFSYLYDGSLPQASNVNTILQLETFSDLMADLISSYDEIREIGFQLTGSCCPPNIFPQHLFIGLLQNDTSTPPLTTCNIAGNYYYPFAPSMAIGSYNSLVNELVMLFRRFVYQYRSFQLPSLTVANNQSDPQLDSTIRITPSVYGRVPFSEKSIAQYYNIPNFPQLLSNWNYSLAIRNRIDRVLSYYAPDTPSVYNSISDNDIVEPGKYLLERTNFLNIDGVVGKGIGSALYTLQTLKSKYRLPFSITFVTTGNTVTDSTSILATLQQFNQIPAAIYQDLEVAYKSTVSEIANRFTKATEILYSAISCLPTSSSSVASNLLLLQDNDAGFKAVPNSIGNYFETSIYPNLKGKAYQVPLSGKAIQNVFTSTDLTDFDVLSWTSFFAVYVPYVLESAYELIRPNYVDLPAFASNNSAAFAQMYQDMEDLCDLIEGFAANAELSSQSGTTTPPTPPPVVGDLPINLQIDRVRGALANLRSLAKKGVMQELANEYITRIANFTNSASFNAFSSTYPGIQHRSGVPMGGTYIMVVHFAATTPTTGQLASVLGVQPQNVLIPEQTISALTFAPGSFNMVNIDYLFLERLRTSFLRSFDPSVGFENALSGVPNGTIIGTFWMPMYVTNTDMPPVQLTLSLNAQPPVVDINPGSYVISISPNDTSLSQTTGKIFFGPSDPNGVLEVNNGVVPKSDFSTSDFSAGDYGPPLNTAFDASLYKTALLDSGKLMLSVPIVYTVGAASATVNAEIYLMPYASFYVYYHHAIALERQDGIYYNVTFNFTDSQYYSNVMWGWGDGSQPTNISNPTTNSENQLLYTHSYKVRTVTQFTAMLSVFNGTYMESYYVTFSISPVAGSPLSPAVVTVISINGAPVSSDKNLWSATTDIAVSASWNELLVDYLRFQLRVNGISTQ